MRGASRPLPWLSPVPVSKADARPDAVRSGPASSTWMACSPTVIICMLPPGRRSSTSSCSARPRVPAGSSSPSTVTRTTARTSMDARGWKASTPSSTAVGSAYPREEPRIQPRPIRPAASPDARAKRSRAAWRSAACGAPRGASLPRRRRACRAHESSGLGQLQHVVDARAGRAGSAGRGVRGCRHHPSREASARLPRQTCCSTACRRLDVCPETPSRSRTARPASSRAGGRADGHRCWPRIGRRAAARLRRTARRPVAERAARLVSHRRRRDAAREGGMPPSPHVGAC